MKVTDLKYLASFSIPASVIVGCYFGNLWYWFTPVFAFVIVPVLEILLPVNTKNLEIESRERKEQDWFFDALLYVNLVLIYSILTYTLLTMNDPSLSWMNKLGLLVSCGITMGSNGINVAHELGHRQSRIARTAAKFLLLPSLYMHFYIEHNFGHHLNAATREDPATARFNQSVYAFWFTSVFRQYFGAWRIQLRLLKGEGRSFWSYRNDMFWGGLSEVIYLLLILLFLGWPSVVFAVSIALISVLLLETINYVEHYGLLRDKTGSGRYERVKTIHSWNSNHVMGRIMLYELTRHSDHHYRASKKYQVLDHHEESPQMPFGYPTSIVLSLFPPLWFYIMNPLIPQRMKQLAA